MTIMPEDDFYVCPNHIATHGWEPCCSCGGWEEDDIDKGRLCTEEIEYRNDSSN